MINTLLVANRGEIARRIMRTCRDLGISTVAVHSDVDADAPFVREADLAVPLGGRTPGESYLRIDAVVEAAVSAGADAVHPGYGFLSENAAFARACADAGLTFVGPPAEAIELMGSKLAARDLMAAAGVPVLPGADLTGLDPERDADAVRAAADDIGWPVLVKASFGGGGRGMRVVRDPAQLLAAVAGARREAAGAFGDDTVFLERYVDDPRHVEIQIFADANGQVVSLFERECSIQRRHQKIIEEAPSPVVTPELRAEMGAAAIEAAKAIGYVGAGTVEFIVDSGGSSGGDVVGGCSGGDVVGGCSGGDVVGGCSGGDVVGGCSGGEAPRGSFYFLEVNTRLQVEHPVTELVTGLDLVALQLRVAEGAGLPDDVRNARMTGHAIEARLYAEDPTNGFLPAGGRLEEFGIDSGPGLRVDSGVEPGCLVSNEYDPMLAKVIAHGATRDEAVRRLVAALRRARVDGVTTNSELLVGVLEHAEFRAGRIDTHFLDRHDPAVLNRLGGASDTDTGLAALAVALSDQAGNRAAAPRWRHAPSGWRNNRTDLTRRMLIADSGDLEVGYRLDRTPRFEVDGEPLDVVLVAAEPGAVRLRVGRVVRRFAVRGAGEAAYVDTGRGTVRLRRRPRFPEPEAHLPEGSLLAPMPGTVVRVAVAEGDPVAAGQQLLVLEAMKMEHEIAAPAAGAVVSLPVALGAAVDTGQVLIVVKAEEEA